VIELIKEGSNPWEDLLTEFWETCGRPGISAAGGEGEERCKSSETHRRERSLHDHRRSQSSEEYFTGCATATLAVPGPLGGLIAL
jgi:hypothetical protein